MVTAQKPPERLVQLTILLSRYEAEGLAHLCRILDWDYLFEHSQITEQATEARYALAKLRFALSDGGFVAMPKEPPEHKLS